MAIKLRIDTYFDPIVRIKVLYLKNVFYCQIKFVVKLMQVLVVKFFMILGLISSTGKYDYW